MLRLVQITHPKEGRRVGLVDENRLNLLRGVKSAYRLVEEAFAGKQPMAEALRGARSQEWLGYDPIYEGQSDWRLLPPFDHPDEPARCLVTGTGLTHNASARNRQAMHAAANLPVTDSMKMYECGLAGGRPEPGKIGVQPEWFYKGCGTCLRAHGEALEVPAFGLDGGEEAEVAGIYWIDPLGAPHRVGMAQANEFSDHKLESQNYLYLASSKLRSCSLGPELIVSPDFSNVGGRVRLLRNGNVLWEKRCATGETNMCHTLANLEHHHFKYPAHRRPRDVHIHFLGADVFSFGDGIELADGDVMDLQWTGFGRPLRNPLRVKPGPEGLVAVEQI
ncbi:MAG: GguC protein [Verrucomicrobia bacterium]|nr:MAG: GguC protein [Verrucomicrobiota bacterium]